MPRTMKEDSIGAFRAVIEKTHADGTSYKLHYGPYATKGTAKGILNTELRWMLQNTWRGTNIVGWLEQTSSEWQKVSN